MSVRSQNIYKSSGIGSGVFSNSSLSYYKSVLVKYAYLTAAITTFLHPGYRKCIAFSEINFNVHSICMCNKYAAASTQGDSSQTYLKQLAQWSVCTFLTNLFHFWCHF